MKIKLQFIFLSATILFLPVTIAAAQTRTEAASADIAAIQHVMDQFHEAVAHHDGDALTQLFLPTGSIWLNVLSDEAFARVKAKSPQTQKVHVSSYKDFAKFVSTTTRKLDPQHKNVVIHTDGTIASVYFDFVFFIDGHDENHGSETWQLVKASDGWLITSITYSSNPSA